MLQRFKQSTNITVFTLKYQTNISLNTLLHNCQNIVKCIYKITKRFYLHPRPVIWNHVYIKHMCDRCYCMDAIIKSCMTFEKTNFLKDLHTIHYFTLEAQPYPNRNSKRIVATHTIMESTQILMNWAYVTSASRYSMS